MRLAIAGKLSPSPRRAGGRFLPSPLGADVESPAGPAGGPDPAPALEVLVIEDEPADVRLLEEAFKGFGMPVRIHREATGDEAMRYLYRTGRDPGTVRPDIIFLDLNLPRKDGRAILAELRGDPALNGIPVIVLTASLADNDVVHAFDLRADAYLRKPISSEDLRRALRRFEFRSDLGVTRRADLN